MNWEIITNERSSLQEYRLIDNHDCKVIIKYNPRHQSARITSGNHHRLFFFESAGSLSGKTIFRNEYGMETGNLVHDKFHPAGGSLVLDGKKFLYRLYHSSSPELSIYENNPDKPLANCYLPENKSAIQDLFSTGLQTISNNCYLLGVCWYVLLPFAKENLLKYLSAGF